MGLVDKTAEALHLKKHAGYIPSAGGERTMVEDGATPSGAAAATKLGAAGPEALGGQVGTRHVAGYAAPGTPLNDPQTWQGPQIPPISDRFTGGAK